MRRIHRKEAASHFRAVIAICTALSLALLFLS